MLNIKQQSNRQLSIWQLFFGILAILFSVLSLSTTAFADAISGGYGLKIYKVESALYPYVQVYFRTFDQNQQPLTNLNELNVGLMVKGKSYDLSKLQYRLSSILQRKEATRSILILDTSSSMGNKPFLEALTAAVRFIESKRPQDEIAILATSDKSNKNGYDVVSEFERDPGTLARRLADVKIHTSQSRIYDTIGAAMQMCGMSSQGSISPSSSNYIISCSIVVFSDGKDVGSALSREELNARISALAIPIPIYSLAYGKNTKDFKNLESLSKNSFGVYYPIGESVERMQVTVEQIQKILLSDYVLTFLSYIPVDGEEHAIKVGVEYPTGSGKYMYESAKMEAIQPPPAPEILALIGELSQLIKPLPAGVSPYLESPVAPIVPVAPTVTPAPAAALPAPAVAPVATPAPAVIPVSPTPVGAGAGATIAPTPVGP